MILPAVSFISLQVARACASSTHCFQCCCTYHADPSPAKTTRIHSPYRDPSTQIIPTLGRKVCKYYLHWATSIPRECVWALTLNSSFHFLLHYPNITPILYTNITPISYPNKTPILHMISGVGLLRAKVQERYGSFHALDVAALNLGVSQSYGYPSGAPITTIRTVVFWGLDWAAPILGNYHFGLEA